MSEAIPAKKGMNEAVGQLAQQLGYSHFYGRGRTIRFLLHAAKELGVQPDPNYRPDYTPYGDGKQVLQVRLHVTLPPGDGSIGLDAMGMGSVVEQMMAKMPGVQIPADGEFSWGMVPYQDDLVYALQVTALKNGRHPATALVDHFSRAVRDTRERWSKGPLKFSKEHFVRLTPEVGADYYKLRVMARHIGVDARSVIIARMMELQGGEE